MHDETLRMINMQTWGFICYLHCVMGFPLLFIITSCLSLFSLTMTQNPKRKTFVWHRKLWLALPWPLVMRFLRQKRRNRHPWMDYWRERRRRTCPSSLPQSRRNLKRVSNCNRSSNNKPCNTADEEEPHNWCESATEMHNDSRSISCVTSSVFCTSTFLSCNTSRQINLNFLFV